MRGYWKDTILTWSFVAVESALEILVAFFLQYLMKAVELNQVNDIFMWAGILTGMALVACLFGIAAGYYASSAACGFGKNMREAMYIKVQDYSFANIDKFSASSIVTRMTTDVTNVQQSFMMIIRMVIRAPLMIVFAMTMAFVTAPSLAWIFLIITPILLVILISIATFAHPIFVKIFDTYDDLNESVQENVDGIRAVKSFDRKAYHETSFNRVSEFIYRNFIKAEKILSFNGPVMNISVYISMVLIAVLGANAIISSGNTTLQINALTTLFTYVMMIMMALMMISMLYVQIIISRNSAERIVEIVVEKSDITSPENPVMEVKDGSIDFNDVSFAYVKDKRVLEHIDLHFKEGQSIGIIGPTGSSKTTLISLIARLFDPVEGEVKVGGIDVKDYDLKTLRDAVSVVLQKNTLFTGTIRDNLKWGNHDATDEELWKACDLAQASEFLKRFPKGLDTQIVEGGTNVSGGQKQRLCIARALLKNPKILILDDSTSACDTHTDALIRSALMNELPKLTKLIIAQRVLSIMDCDEIIVMDVGGEMLDSGTHQELMERCPVYSELYESQIGGGDFDAN